MSNSVGDLPTLIVSITEFVVELMTETIPSSSSGPAPRLNKYSHYCHLE